MMGVIMIIKSNQTRWNMRKDQPEEISDDGGATVILRSIPRQLHVLSSHLFIYSSYTNNQLPTTILKCPENHLIRLEQPWLAWYVEHVDKASCFKAESEGSFEDYVERNIVLVEYSLNDSVPNMNGG